MCKDKNGDVKDKNGDKLKYHLYSSSFYSIIISINDNNIFMKNNYWFINILKIILDSIIVLIL